MEYFIVNSHQENANVETMACSSADFFILRDFVNKQTCEEGYGLLVSNPILHTYANGTTSHRYIISNIVKSYVGNDVIEPLGEWDDNTQEIILYDAENSQFFNEGFMNACRECK